jgi:hypothetical protein
MRRGYRCAFCPLFLFACLLSSGCSSSGTARLTVTTTSLPNGGVGAPYTASLNASGGTPGYTWSEVSGGAIPKGVSLGSSGIFNGAPQVAGNFGPYVFQVTDSVGAIATTGNLTITIANAGLSVATTSLPQGNVNTAYSATLAAANGTPPYTWTQNSGGAMPPGIAGITSAGVIAGTPTTGGTYGPYGFTVTDSANATAASALFTITIGSSLACVPMGNESALAASTPYGFLLKGIDGNGKPVDIAGSFTPDGTGHILSASTDYNGFTNGPQQLQVNLAASSYSFGSSTLGCLALVFSGPVAGTSSARREGAAPPVPSGSAVRPADTKLLASASAPPSGVLFSFSLGGFDGTLYHTGRIIESDNLGGGTNASGFLRVQSPAAFSLSSLQPNYAFGVEGWTAAPTGLFRTALAGSFTNLSGVLSSGFSDLDLAGAPSGELTGGNGTLNSSIDASTGRGTGTYTIPTPSGNLTFDFAFYVLNASDLILLSTDLSSSSGAAPLLSGRALASNATYPPGSLNGYYLLASQGLDAAGSRIGNFAQLGTMNATSAGTIPSATLYVNDSGTFTTSVHSNAAYSLEAASGRVSFTALLTAPPVVYLTAVGAADDQIAGFLVGSDINASSGVLVTQSATVPAYLLSSITGNYAASTQEDPDGFNGAALGAFSFDGAGQYTTTQTTTGSVSIPPSSGSITVNPDGSGSLNNGSFPFVTNGNLIFAIPNSGDPLLYVFTAPTFTN